MDKTAAYDFASLYAHVYSQDIFNIRREICGLQWVIEPRVLSGNQKYHEREINLKLLDNIIDIENYNYTYYGNLTFFYKKGALSYKKPGSKTKKHLQSNMRFEEVCDYIKKLDEKHLRS